MISWDKIVEVFEEPRLSLAQISCILLGQIAGTLLFRFIDDMKEEHGKR